MPSNADKAQKPQRETIDIEDDDTRAHRIERLLQELNTVPPAAGSSVNAASILDATGTSSSGEGSGKSFDELLARVQAFLPEMEASNAELAKRAAVDPRSIDIENVEGDEKVIQMNLGLGIFEDRSRRKDTDSSSEGDSEIDDESEDGSDEDSDESSSEDSYSDGTSERQYAPLPKRALLSRAIKPLPRRAQRPEIIVLSETRNEDQ